MRRLHNSKFSLMRRLVMAGAVLATLAGIGTAPALADDWGHRGDGWRHEQWRGEERRQHEWREHEWREHEWRERHAYDYGAPRYYYAPGYVYAPPPVAYPPPAYVEPGLNLGFYFR